MYANFTLSFFFPNAFNLFYSFLIGYSVFFWTTGQIYHLANTIQNGDNALEKGRNYALLVSINYIYVILMMTRVISPKTLKATEEKEE